LKAVGRLKTRHGAHATPQLQFLQNKAGKIILDIPFQSSDALRVILMAQS